MFLGVNLVTLMFVSLFSSMSGSENVTDLTNCNRPWPALSIFLPVRTFMPEEARFREFQEIFLRSFLFFWPFEASNTSLILQHDTEAVWDTKNEPYFAAFNETVKNIAHRIPAGVSVVGVPKYPFYESGHDRQQYNMFWADNFTTSDYVGFVDTDAVFITYIDREDLWENSKPVANCQAGRSAPGHQRWFNSTQRVLKTLMPFNCMSYFPVVIKTSHFKEIREHLVTLHNKTSFGEVFRDVILSEDPAGYSQFCIMMTYLWNKHKDEYTWYCPDPHFEGTIIEHFAHHEK